MDATGIRLSVILVNWNSTVYLGNCISSVREWCGDMHPEIIVVDNASPDGDVDVLGERYDDIRIIKCPVNLGFGRANNVGFRLSTGQYILFLNPDTELNSPAIQLMLNGLLTLEDAGVIGCRLLNGDLSVQTSCIQSFPTILNQALDTDVLRSRWPRSRLWGIGPLFGQDDGAVAVEVVSGACMLMRREVFERVGLFSEEYFMYGEDLDLCYKVVKAGYRNYYVGGATVIHYGGGSSGNPELATVRKWESIVHYCVKNHGRAYGCAFAAVIAAVALSRIVLLALAGLLFHGNQPARGSYSAVAKWRTVLRTVVNRGALWRQHFTS